MNKIDDFFKNRLDVNSSENDDWNIPSDDMWNAALPHFPKEKKRKSFLWLWFCIGFFGIVGMAVLLSSDFYNSSLNTEVLNESNRSGDNVGAHLVVDDLEEIGNQSTNIDQGSVQNVYEANGKQVDEIVKLVQSAAEPKINFIVDKDLDGMLSNSSELIVVTEELDKENEILPVEIIALSMADDQRLGVEGDSLNTASTQLIRGNGISDNSIEDLSDGIASRKSDSDLNTEKGERVEENVPVIGTRLSRSLVTAETRFLEEKEFPFLEPKVVVWPRKEIGVSNQLFFLSLLNGRDLDDSPDGRVVFDGRYRNLNFKYTKWIGRKWSISTGLNLADLSVNLDFDTEVTYDEDEFEELIDSEYGEVFDRNYNSNSSKVVKLKPGVELVNGDILKMNGQVDLGLRALQIPIILNYHWYNKRVEFYTGLGIALESIWASEKNVEFKLFEDGVLISDPVDQIDINESYFDLSVYTKLGAKFNVTRKINFDVNLSLLITQPIFSGIELGLHYRWHQ